MSIKDTSKTDLRAMLLKDGNVKAYGNAFCF